MFNNNLKESYIAHQKWLETIAVIRQLQELCFEVRAHRGSTTAELLGDVFFSPISRRTSHNIDRILHNLGREIRSDDYHILNGKWLQIQSNWPEKKAINNFNDQTAYLEYINSLIWQLAVQSSPDIEKPSSKKAQMCIFLLQSHSQAIESIAKLRGLSCYLCALENITAKDVSLVRKAAKNAMLHWEQRHEHLISLDSEQQIALFVQKPHSQLTQLLIDLIEQIKPTLRSREHQTNASQLFNQANQLLTQLQLQYELGLDHLATCLPEDLQYWLNSKSHEDSRASIMGSDPAMGV